MLSVVIASVNGFPIVGECLDSLSQQVGDAELEIVVSNRCGDGVGARIRQKYPWVKLIEAPARTPIPELRARAFRECRGDVVAVLEDHCIVERDWASRVMEAHRGEYPVIGGTVANGAGASLSDWAAFFCEYSAFMTTLPEGEAEEIPGNNVAYKRCVIERFWPKTEAGLWDSAFHQQIRRAGLPLYRLPSLTVRHKLSRNLAWFITQKFHFARSFSSARFADAVWLRRVAYGAGALLLPLILALRIISQVCKAKVHRRELMLCFPILMLLLVSWAIGEAAGYLFGPGSSHAKVA